MIRPQNRLFWKIGFVYLLMLLIVLIILDIYVVQALKREYLEAAFSQLESLSLWRAKAAASFQIREAAEWSEWLAHERSAHTLIANDGTVLADSEENPAKDAEPPGPARDTGSVFLPAPDGPSATAQRSGTIWCIMPGGSI